MSENRLVTATFNLRRDCAADRENRWKYRKEAVVGAIRSFGADVIGVQEMTPVMKAELETLLPEYIFLGRPRCRGHFGEHNDILVRRGGLSIEQADTFWLSASPERPGSRALAALFPRICTMALLRDRDGQLLRVVNTHFDNLTGFARSAAARRLLARLGGAPELPTVLLGDLNARPDSTAVRLLTAADAPAPLRDAVREYAERRGRARRATFHFFGKEPDRHIGVIDYIFISPAFAVERAALCDARFAGRYPSDHFPLTAELAY